MAFSLDQVVEQSTGNPKPAGANPVGGQINDKIFAKNFLIFKGFSKNFFQIIQDKTAMLSLFQKHLIKPNHIIIFSGLSLQGSAHGRSQKPGFVAAIKQKVQSHGRYVSAAANFSKCLPKK